MRSRVTEAMLDAAAARARAAQQQGGSAGVVTITSEAQAERIFGEGSVLANACSTVVANDRVRRPVKRGDCVHPESEPTDVPPPGLMCSARLGRIEPLL